MNAPQHQIRDVKVVNDGGQKSVAVEFGDGRVRTFTGKDLYEASRFLGQAPADTGNRTAAQRRAEEFLSSKRRR